MVKYSIGQRISLISYSGKRGRIESYVSSEGGYNYYEVLWDDGSLEVISDSLIKPEVKINTPWDLIANNEFFDYRDFSIATTFHKIRNTTANTISSLKASRTIFKPYQYKPLVKFLKSDLRRVLIADEVGLGKTIEAGHIMLELAFRQCLIYSAINAAWMPYAVPPILQHVKSIEFGRKGEEKAKGQR